MSPTTSGDSSLRLAEALDALVARGAISAEQRTAILAEVGVGHARIAPPHEPRTPPRSPRRPLTEILIEVGLYVGSALVLAAVVVLVAQNWADLGETAQILILAATAAVTGPVGWALSRGAGSGSARRRLAGVVLTATAASAAGAIALALGDREWTGVVALAAATALMLAARRVAASAVTEIGLFAATFALVQVTGEWVRPQDPVVLDAWGEEISGPSAYDRLLPLAYAAFGALWALAAAPRLMHRELAIALGMLVAFFSAMPLAAEEETRALGLAALAALAAIGFWRFLVEGHWPWLAAAIASVTALVFWAFGGADRPVVAILVAGLVLLGSSGLGMRVARRRRAASQNQPDSIGAAP